MILNTEKWYSDNKKNMSKEEIDDAEYFMECGCARERFYKGFCSCCGQYADATLEDVDEVDEETGMMKLSYTCMPCFIKHKLPLSDEEFDKVKEELPECVKQENEKYIKELLENHPNTVEECEEFFKQLCS